MRRALLAGWLTFLWVLLWRDLSTANVLSGVVVAAVVLTAYPLRPHLDSNQQVHPGRLALFVGYFLWQVVTSNVLVARAILSPRSRITTGIIAVPLKGCSDFVTTVVGNALSLTPGSLTIEVDREPRVIYVHVLHIHDIDEVRRSVHKMTRTALKALVVDSVVADFDRAVAVNAKATDLTAGGHETP